MTWWPSPPQENERFTIGNPPALMREPHGDARGQAREIEVAGPLRHFALFGLDEDANRAPERVFDARLQRQQVRPAEAVVLIARQQPFAVDVGAAERRLEVERHLVAAARGGGAHQQPDADGALPVARPRHRRARGRADGLRALVRAVEGPRPRGRHAAVQRNLVPQVHRPSVERRSRVAACAELLRRQQVVEPQPSVRHRRPEPQAFVELHERRLLAEARRGHVVVHLLDRRGLTGIPGADGDEPAADAGDDRRTQSPDGLQPAQREDARAADDRLPLAVDRSPALRARLSGPEVVDRAERDRLREDVDDRMLPGLDRAGPLPPIPAWRRARPGPAS